MNSNELCDIRNMLSQVVAVVRHLEASLHLPPKGGVIGLQNEEELIKALTGEKVLSALKSALQLDEFQGVATVKLEKTKEESRKEEKSSPTPLSIEKKGREKKRSSLSSEKTRIARPRDAEEVQKYIDDYCKSDQTVVPGLMDGQEFFDIMIEREWKRKKGKLIRDWKSEVRRFIRFRSALHKKQQQALLNKARLENLRHKNIMAERGRKESVISAPQSVDYAAQEAERRRKVEERRQGSCSYEEYQRLKAEGRV